MAEIDEIEEWLIGQALGSPNMTHMFEELCLRLRGCGVLVDRAMLAWATLHPLFEAEIVFWENGEAAQHQQFGHDEKETEDWLSSPMRHVLEQREARFRRRLVGGNASLDFPLLQTLADTGYSDYLILATKFGTPTVRNELDATGIIVSWATRHPDGFSDDVVHGIEYIQKRLALAARATLEAQITRTIADTYLGRFAGSKVLTGQIRHGDGERIEAVIYYSDMRDSTAIAEALGPDAYLKWLNGYFNATAGAVLDNGGEVLDFIGDAVLGVFPIQAGDLKGPVEQAVAAAEETRSRLERLNSEPGCARKMKAGVALSVGEVTFGNIGVPTRLTFSVIGQTVHAAARIEALTKTVGTDVLITEDIASLIPHRHSSVGEFALSGFSSRQPLFALL